jgi:predicted GNAT family N-acyltransferase
MRQIENQSMNGVMIRVATLPADLPQIYRVRYQVFQIEQGVDPSLEFDGKDENALHILASVHSKPVGTARIRFLNPVTAKVERVAVLPEVRGLGIGKKIMEEVFNLLMEKQVQEVQIHAQEQVRAFYIRLGFEPEGEIFEEADIPHVKMKKLLRSQVNG